MDKFVIKGGRRLSGEVTISGAKNAVVAILPAVILSDEPCIIENVPDISDVRIGLKILREIGAEVTNMGNCTYKIDPTKICRFCVPYESAKKMRASYYFLGALLGKYNKARVSMPGGCPLGARPTYGFPSLQNPALFSGHPSLSGQFPSLWKRIHAS